MARRRRPERAPVAGAHDAPDELHRCVVEDWVDEQDPADAAELDERQRRLDTTDREFAARMLAYRRWQSARAAWGDERELTPKQRVQVLGGGGRPARRAEFGDGPA